MSKSNRTPSPIKANPSAYLIMPTKRMIRLLLSIQGIRLPAEDRRKRVPVAEIRRELRRREVLAVPRMFGDCNPSEDPFCEDDDQVWR